MKKVQKLRDQLISTYVAEGIHLVCGLAFGIIAARELTPEGRGVMSAAWTAVTIGVMIANLGVGKSLISRLNENGSRLTAADYYGGLIALWPVLSVIAWVVIMAFAPSLPAESRTALLAILLLAAPIMLVTGYARSVLRAKRRIQVLNVIVAIGAVLRIIAILILQYIGAITVLSVLIIEVAHWIVVGVIAYSTLTSVVLSRPRFTRVFSAIWSMLSYGLLIQAYSIMFNLIPRLNIPALSLLTSHEAVGHFTVGARFAEYLGMFANQIVLVIVPYIAQRENRGAALWKSLLVTRLSILFLVPAGVGLIALAGWLIPVLYGDAYMASVAPLRIMVVAVILGTVFQFSAMSAIATGRLKSVTICACIGLVANLSLMFVLIPRFEAVGAAMAVTAGYAAALIAHLVALTVWSNVSYKEVLLPTLQDVRAVRRW